MKWKLRRIVATLMINFILFLGIFKEIEILTFFKEPMHHRPIKLNFDFIFIWKRLNWKAWPVLMFILNSISNVSINAFKRYILSSFLLSPSWSHVDDKGVVFAQFNVAYWSVPDLTVDLPQLKSQCCLGISWYPDICGNSSSFHYLNYYFIGSSICE